MTHALLTVLLAICLASSTVLAAPECTQAQLDEGKKLADDPAIKTACPVVLANGNLTSLDMTTRLASANPCGMPTCATYLAQLTGKFADCQNDGVNLRSLVAAFIEFCKSESGSASTSNSTNNSSSSTGSKSTEDSDSSADKEAVTLPDRVETTPTSTPSPTSAGGSAPAGSSSSPSHLLAGSVAAFAVATITLFI